MQLEESATEDLVKRLRRVEGQIGGIIRMLEEGRDCTEIVTQMAAASKALDRAGFKLLATGMRQCVTAATDGETVPMTTAEMEKLFLTLA